jgi:hypothetical protein
MRCGRPHTDHVETVSLAVVKNGSSSHVKNKCRLYVPTYTINAKYEGDYASGSKLINYHEIFSHRFTADSGKRIDNLISPSQTDMEKLIIVPMLSREANGTTGLLPMESLYASEPTCCSPHLLSNFQVLLSKKPLYSNTPEYKYESFLREMNLGVNAGMQNGLSSGLISYKDYIETYGYIVVDISRREDFLSNVPTSLEIRGSIASPKALDFCMLYCLS